MGSKICMNEVCRSTTSSEWKNGWGLKSGGFATLCFSCGTAYEKYAYCDTFHVDEDGWRECRICRKRVHCGCVASKLLLECLDFGGVGCLSCIKRMEASHSRPLQILGAELTNGTLTKDVVPPTIENGKRRNFGELLEIGNGLDANGSRKLLRVQRTNQPSLVQSRNEGTMLPFGEVNTSSPNFIPQPIGSSRYAMPDSHRPEQGVKDTHEPVVQPALNISLSNSLGASTSAIPFSDALVEGSEQNKGSPSQKGRSVLPKPPKPGYSAGSDASRGPSLQARIARPPAEGRGRSQLLPRYWPRITEQELQQIAGDLKSTIVPLFEKVLSASDAGRIGRLVLPKACAEAYFPPINQSEGLPIRIQDVKGKEWTFQFRFWPNNNSRMYVLEGVTPCIQNMQLQAGDTVTFSRIDPGGQLVMGFRRSSSSIETQDPQPSTPILPNGGSSGENSQSGASDTMLDNVKNGNHTAEDSLQRQAPVSEKKKTRNIGSKTKRLHMHSDEAFELRVTWEEAQELLRPPPLNNPTITKIEDYEFEEYDEPPVFGKRTIFTVGPSGNQEQWAQCDTCSKWRKLPVHVLVSARWTCSDADSSCSAPDEINPREQEALNKASKDYKKRTTKVRQTEECEPSGLDALATAAVLGDNGGDLAESSVSATTRHPRHRPGCSCIVCIQPPSGKGKHPPNCKCTVCLTVKRRFKTLMQRKQQRQSDREAELAQGLNQDNPIDISEIEGAAEIALLQMNQTDNGISQTSRNQMVDAAAENGGGKGQQLDLNCHPSREDDMLAEAASGMNMDSLMDAARIPLDMYFRQNGLSHGLLPHNNNPTQRGEGGSEGEGPYADEGFDADNKVDDE